MIRRVLALLSARLRSQLGGELVPAAALLSQGALVGGLCLLVRGDLGSFGYSLFALAASAGLVSLTLLGEFGTLLVADPAADWSEALPARAVERRLAHGLAVLVLLAALTFGVLLAAALAAPPEMSWLARGLLIAVGLGQSVALGAGLLTFQVVLGERAEGWLVLIQTVLVVFAVGGLLAAPGIAPQLAAIEEGNAAWPDALNWLPPAWYASIVGEAPAGAGLPAIGWVILGTLAAFALLVGLPPARHRTGRKSATLLSRLLAPARSLALKFWVRPSERGAFDLVHDALPLERDFVVRTYPMVGIPLAFLIAGTRGEGGEALHDLLALLLFTPAVYLPVLLAHVPVTSSPEARWILETAPVAERDVRSGAIKALAVRFLLPLYLALGGLAWFLAGVAFTWRLALPGALVSLISLRLLYPRCVVGAPLSVAPDEIEVHHDWTGLLISLAAALTVLALVAQRVLVSPLQTLALIVALLITEAVLSRRG